MDSPLQIVKRNEELVPATREVLPSTFVYFELSSYIELARPGFQEFGRAFVRFSDFVGIGCPGDCFVINGTDKEEVLATLIKIRATPEHCLKPVFLIQDSGPLAASLSDGLVTNVNDVKSEFSRFIRQAGSVWNLPLTDNEEVRLLRYLYMRPDLVLTPAKNWNNQRYYYFPLVEAMVDERIRPLDLLNHLLRKGLLEPVKLVDRIRVCPKCKDAHLDFVDVCPNCHSLDIGEAVFLHCFTCGNIAPQAEYLRAGILVCPTCQATMRHIGVDYDRALDNFSCQDCRHNFNEPQIEARCRICPWTGTTEQLVAMKIESLRLSALGRLAVSTGNAYQQITVTDQLNYVNLPVFQHIVDWWLNLTQRYSNMHFSLVCIKLVNLYELIEQLGSNRVMMLLDGVTERLRAICRTTDLATRTSEQVFWLMLPNTPKDGCMIVLQRILAIQQLTRQPEGCELIMRGIGLELPQDMLQGETGELLMARLLSEIN